MNKTIAFLVIAEVPSEDWADESEMTKLGSHGSVASPSSTAQRNVTEQLQSLGFENVRIEPTSNLGSYR